MKSFKSVVISLFVLCLFSMVMGQGFENSIGDEVFTVYKTSQAPVIDGVMDSSWVDIEPWGVVFLDNDQILDDATDHIAWVRMTYDAENLYFFFDVTDDYLAKDETAPHDSNVNDMVELFFDGDNSDGWTREDLEAAGVTVQDWWLTAYTGQTKTYDGNNDVQFQSDYDENGAGVGNRGPGGDWGREWDTTGLEVMSVVKDADLGFTKEWKIPFTALKIDPADLVDGYEIGLGIQIPDVDMVGEPKTQIAWHKNTDKNWIDPSLFQTVKFSTQEFSKFWKVPTYKTDTAPVIDGVMDDIWLQASARSVVVLDNDQELDDAQDHSAWFKMLWDDSNLYFYFFVLDDNLAKDETAPHDSNVNDMVELFFDGDNSDGWTREDLEAEGVTVQDWWLTQYEGQTTTYDGYNDVQFQSDYDEDAAGLGNRGPGGDWAREWDLTGLEVASENNDGDLGFVKEWKIPFSVLHIETEDIKDGWEIGLGVQIPDVDMVGETKTQIAWHINNDKNWIDPSLFSTIYLSSAEATAVEKETEKSITVANFSLAQNYPNPFNPTTSINYSIPKQSRVQLSVYNILGKQVATLVNKAQSAGSYSINFDASELTSGIYFYKLQIDNQMQMKKMTLVK